MEAAERTGRRHRQKKERQLKAALLQLGEKDYKQKPLQYPLGLHESSLPVAAEGSIFHSALAVSVQQLVVAGVNGDVGNAFGGRTGGFEKDEIAFFEVVNRNRRSYVSLVSGYPRQGDAVFGIDRFGEAGAVERSRLAVLSAKIVRRAQVTLARLNNRIRLRSRISKRRRGNDSCESK